MRSLHRIIFLAALVAAAIGACNGERPINQVGRGPFPSSMRGPAQALGSLNGGPLDFVLLRPGVPTYSLTRGASGAVIPAGSSTSRSTPPAQSSSDIATAQKTFSLQMYVNPTTLAWIQLDTTYVIFDQYHNQWVHSGDYIETFNQPDSEGGPRKQYVIVCAFRYIAGGCQQFNDSAVLFDAPGCVTTDAFRHCPHGVMPWDTTYVFDGVTFPHAPSPYWSYDSTWSGLTSWVQAQAVNADGSLIYEMYNAWYGYDDMYLSTNTQQMGQITASDAAGAAQFTSCTSNGGHCNFGVAMKPASNVVLAVAGPYPRVTWSNNGDFSIDSSEVWFGKQGQEVKLGTYPSTVTQAYGTWNGGGIYDAYIIHRIAWHTPVLTFYPAALFGIVTARATSNSLTH